MSPFFNKQRTEIKKYLIVIQPLIDYWRTRRNVIAILAFPLLFAELALWYALLFDTKTSTYLLEEFESFINIQINVVAILISFSVAIIAILISSDSECIRKLRELKTIDIERYRCIGDNKKLSLFQIILSNIAYNIIIEVFYLVILIVQVFLKLIIGISWLKYLVALDIFFIIHILIILLISVSQMYLTFWTAPSEKGDDH